MKNSMKIMVCAALISGTYGLMHAARSFDITNNIPFGADSGFDVKLIGTQRPEYNLSSYKIYWNISKGQSTLTIPLGKDRFDEITAVQVRRHQDGDGDWGNSVYVDGTLLNNSYFIQIFFKKGKGDTPFFLEVASNGIAQYFNL